MKSISVLLELMPEYYRVTDRLPDVVRGEAAWKERRYEDQTSEDASSNREAEFVQGGAAAIAPDTIFAVIGRREVTKPTITCVVRAIF